MFKHHRCSVVSYIHLYECMLIDTLIFLKLVFYEFVIIIVKRSTQYISPHMQEPKHHVY